MSTENTNRADDNIQHGIDDDPHNDATKGAKLGGIGGVVTGAVAGSVAGPIGTVVGAVVGGIAGAVGAGAAVGIVDTMDNDNNISGVGGGVNEDSHTTMHHTNGNIVEEAAKNTSAALILTPKVKNALIMDSQLNDPRNTIDVDSADNVVHLKGHVYSPMLKERASAIVQQVLTEGNSTDRLSNELVVRS